MEINLSSRDIDAIAYKVALILTNKMKGQASDEVPEMVTTAEAAKILHITPKRMREIAHRYPHVKRGDSRQAPLLFVRKSLLTQ